MSHEVEGETAYQAKHINLEPLNGCEKLLHLKFRKNDHLITSIGGRLTDQYQRVDMALW